MLVDQENLMNKNFTGFGDSKMAFTKFKVHWNVIFNWVAFFMDITT